MKIHTSKRAMLMRSVDRRNDSFGAGTEEVCAILTAQSPNYPPKRSFGAGTEEVCAILTAQTLSFVNGGPCYYVYG